MTVKIHLVCKVADEQAYKQFVDLAVGAAAARLWPCATISVQDPRLVAELPPDRGPLRGAVVEPEAHGAPLHLLFDNALCLKTTFSTQTADVEAHVAVVQFLRMLEPLCTEFDVRDESGYWHTRDLTALRDALRLGARDLEDNEAALDRAVGSPLTGDNLADLIIKASAKWKPSQDDEKKDQ